MKRFQFLQRPAGAAVALTVALATGFGVGHIVHASAINPVPSFRFASPNETPTRTGFAPVAKKALAEVVNISSSKVVKTPTGFDGQQMDPFFRRFFGEPEGRVPRAHKQQSLGSGVIVSPEGYILTNNHVIDGATDVRVTLPDKREFQARVVGSDPKTDIAVLKVDAGTLPAIVIGDSSKVQAGDYALAIGNPFGVGETVTMGIVSATGRGGLGIEDYEDFIQTDAPINPGNSGGALINDRGELVGINTAILAHGSEGNQGIGFAVPVNLARQVMDQILTNGKVTRGYMGVSIQEVTPAIAKAFHTDVRGALVGDVTPDSPAQSAGIQRGDIIVELNGKPVADSNQLRMAISMMQPGSTVNLTTIRNGEKQQVSVKLGELPSKQERASVDNQNAEGGLDGVAVANPDPDAKSPGVVVTEVDPSSAAADAGLRRGDVIQQVNRKPVRNKAEFEAAVRHAGKDPLLLVNREGTTLFLAV